MDVTSIRSKLNLDNLEKTISQPYHETGPGRAPRSPLGIFKALLIKQHAQTAESYIDLRIKYSKITFPTPTNFRFK